MDLTLRRGYLQLCVRGCLDYFLYPISLDITLTSWQSHSQCVISYLFDEEKATLSVRLPSTTGECCEQLRACTALGSPPQSVDPQRSKDAAGAGLTKDFLRTAWRAWIPAKKHS